MLNLNESFFIPTNSAFSQYLNSDCSKLCTFADSAVWSLEYGHYSAAPVEGTVTTGFAFRPICSASRIGSYTMTAVRKLKSH